MSDFDDAVRAWQSAEVRVKELELELLKWEHQDSWRKGGSDTQDQRHKEIGRQIEERLMEAKRDLENKRKAVSNHKSE